MQFTVVSRDRVVVGHIATVSAQNETPINAPWRVRVVEMVVEVTSEHTTCALNSYHTVDITVIVLHHHIPFHGRRIRVHDYIMFTLERIHS